jgi:hypothetical protein
LAKILTVSGKARYECQAGASPGEYFWARRGHSGTVSENSVVFGDYREPEHLGAVLIIIPTSTAAPGAKPSLPLRPGVPAMPDMSRFLPPLFEPSRFLPPMPEPSQFMPPKHESSHFMPPMPEPTHLRPWLTKPSPPATTLKTVTTTTTPRQTKGAVAAASVSKRSANPASPPPPSPGSGLPPSLPFALTGKTPAPPPPGSTGPRDPNLNMEWASYTLVNSANVPQPNVLLYRVLTKGGAPTRGGESCNPATATQYTADFTAQFWVYEDPSAPSPLWPTGRLCTK